MSNTKKAVPSMRELNADDLTLLFRAVSAIGSDEIASLANDPQIVNAVSKIGKGDIKGVGIVVVMRIVAIVIKNYEACSPVLFQLLANLTGKSVDDIKACGLGTYAAMLKALFMSSGMHDFFTELLPSVSVVASQNSEK